MKLYKASALAAVAIMAFAACTPGASTAPSTGASEAPASAAPSGGAVDDPLGTVEIPAGEPIHIAYWGVLSGADASLGQDSRQGVQIAVDDHGRQASGHEILLTHGRRPVHPRGRRHRGDQKLAADKHDRRPRRLRLLRRDRRRHQDASPTRA